jgi:hypothetical protein
VHTWRRAGALGRLSGDRFLAMTLGLMALGFAPHDPPELLPHVGVPATFVHQPAGALAEGTTSVTKLGAAWHFRFEGEETVDYVVDLDHPDVRRGMIRVMELALTGGAEPVAQGGLSWRWGTQPWHVDSPDAHADQTWSLLVGETLDEASGELRLTYRELRDGKAGLKTYTFRLEGQVLRIRLTADPEVGDDWLGGYGGVRMAPVRSMPGVREQHIPFMDSVPVFAFEPVTGGTAFATVFVDWYRSSASNVDVQPPTDLGPGSMQTFMGTNYFRNSEGRINAPIDDTVNVLVTRDVSATFPAIAFEPSPYHAMLRDRMVFNAPSNSPSAWEDYELQLNSLAAWGVDDLFGTMFEWERYGLLILGQATQSAGLSGCDPTELVVEQVIEDAPSLIPGVFGMPDTLRVVDPTDPANVALANDHFGSLMDTAHEQGVLVSLYQDWGGLDQHGWGPYAQGEGPYPVDVPLWRPEWVFQDGQDILGLALSLPSQAPEYAEKTHRLVRDDQGVPKAGFDANLALEGSSWDSQGHAHHVVSPSFMEEHLADGLDEVMVPYAPDAIFVDVIHEVPTFLRIDQVAGSERAHTVWQAEHELRTAIEGHKANVGGPLLGENSHFRRFQWDSYLSGLFDGRHRKFPVFFPLDTSEGPGAVNADSWVIPDYEQTWVRPRSAADSGMGREIDHMSPADWGAQMAVDGCVNFPPGNPYPLDCLDGSWHPFLDSWWTNLVTYGHSAFMTSNGQALNAVRSMEGILREYYLIGGLQRAYHAAGDVTVGYVHSGGEATLSEALGSLALDLTNPRVHLSYDTGLQIWANHEVLAPGGGPGGDWAVSVPDLLPDGTPAVHRMTVPPNGFVASDGQGLLVFSAHNPDSPGAPHRIDYARVPGRWEMICTRGDGTQTFGGFPGFELLEELPADGYEAHTVIRNDRRNLLVGAIGGVWNSVADAWLSGLVTAVPLEGAELVPTVLVVAEQEGRNSASVGQRLGFTATLDLGPDASGHPRTRDVTPLVDWSVDSGAAIIDGNGALTALSVGPVAVSAVWDDGVDTLASSPWLVSVVSGEPVVVVAPLPPSVPAGSALALDGSASFDPDGGPIASWWSPEGEPQALAGAAVTHTFHRPGDVTARLSVTDRQGTTTVQSFPLTVTGAPGLIWADDFDGPVLDGWSFDPTLHAWGLEGGELVAHQDIGNFQVLVADEVELLHGSVEVDLRLEVPPLMDHVPQLAPGTGGGPGAGGTGTGLSGGLTSTKTGSPATQYFTLGPGAAGSIPELTVGAGLHLRRQGGPDQDPTQNGYAVGLLRSRRMALFEGNQILAATNEGVPYDPADVQHLRVDLIDLGGGSLLINVLLDGELIMEAVDATPQPGTGVGLAMLGVKAAYDRFRVVSFDD